MEIEVTCVACKNKIKLDWPENDGVLEFSVFQDLCTGILSQLFSHHNDTRKTSSDPDVRDALAQTHSSGHIRYRFSSGVTVEFADEYEIEVHGNSATIS